MRSRICLGLVVSVPFLTTGQDFAFAQSEKALCEVVPIMASHTFPPYPVAAVKNREEGAVSLHVIIGPSGSPENVSVEKSSSFPDLDEASSNWVKNHFLWQPPQSDCRETRVSLNWSLGRLDADAIAKALMDYPPSEH